MEDAIRSLRVYFSLHRSEVGHRAVPSEFSDEIMAVIKAGVVTGEPKAFLRRFGILLFEKCCAFNMGVLSESISSSRSRLLKAFRRERWNTYNGDIHGMKAALKEVVGDAEVRNWSLREYPEGSVIVEYLAKNKSIVHEVEKRCLPSLAAHEPIELTLQKDIYVYTFFYDA